MLVSVLPIKPLLLLLTLQGRWMQATVISKAKGKGPGGRTHTLGPEDTPRVI